LSQKETPEFIAPQLWPPNSPDLILVDYIVRTIAREGVQNNKTRVADINELKQQLRTE